MTDFADAYEDNLPVVWRYVRARINDHDRAQDVCADVFARALSSWHRYDPTRGTTAAFVLAIARNTVIDALRRTGPRRRVREEPADQVPDPSEAYVTSPPGPEDAVIEEELLGELRAHVGRLTEREQEALALRFGSELSAAEVGAVLGVSEGAAKMIVHRAVVKLREVVGHDV